MIAGGQFREDLYFRIGEITVTLPPLRERAGDVILLARTLVNRYAGERNLRLSKDCMAAMEAWSWPGNIRELENRIKRACIMADGRFITPRDLDLTPDEDQAPLNLKEVRAEAERQAILRALGRCNDNVSQAARLLGISRPTLYNLFSKHGLTVEPIHE
jgi:two-component system NtrC family response regulator